MGFQLSVRIVKSTDYKPEIWQTRHDDPCWSFRWRLRELSLSKGVRGWHVACCCLHRCDTIETQGSFCEMGEGKNLIPLWDSSVHILLWKERNFGPKKIHWYQLVCCGSTSRVVFSDAPTSMFLTSLIFLLVVGGNKSFPNFVGPGTHSKRWRVFGNKIIS